VPRKLIGFSSTVVVGVVTSVISAVLILILIDRDALGIFTEDPRIGHSVNTPNLGVQVFQGGELVTSSVGENSISRFEMRAEPFSFRIPASHWSSAEEDYPAVSIIISDRSVLLTDPWDESVAAGQFYMPGTGMAAYNFGTGSLSDAGLDCPNKGVVTDGMLQLPQNYLVGDRTDRSNSAYREIYVSSILNICNNLEMINPGAKIYFVIRLIDAAATSNFSRDDIELIEIAM
jgi:hypothetical protein